MRFPFAEWPLFFSFAGHRGSDDDYSNTDEFYRTGERRQHRLRKDDEDQLDPDRFRGYEFWTKLMLVHHGKMIALGPLIGILIGYSISVYRFNTRLSSLETKVESLNVDVTKLKDGDALQSYMLCTLIKTVTPEGTPPECGPPSAPTPLPRRPR